MKKLINSGCVAYLATVVDDQKKVPVLEKIPIVRECANVFPMELLRMPPDWKIEFVIDLLAGTLLISMAPYRMAPAELKELKGQLQDLLENGFVKPSVSPWEASMLFFKKKNGLLQLGV